MEVYLVRVDPSYAPYVAVVRVAVPAGPDPERRALACACVVTRVCLQRHGLIPKETS